MNVILTSGKEGKAAGQPIGFHKNSPKSVTKVRENFIKFGDRKN
jgi:hypothetical protein